VAALSESRDQVGGDYLDIVSNPNGSPPDVVPTLPSKGLALAPFTLSRSAFRALARPSLTLRELAGRLSQQPNWTRALEARRLFTAIFLPRPNFIRDGAGQRRTLPPFWSHPATLRFVASKPVNATRDAPSAPRYSIGASPLRPGAVFPLHRWLDRNLPG